MPTVESTYIENRERILPNQTNNHDTAHGGIVMKLMDEIAGMAAMRVAGEPCVTARVNGLDFQRPIPRGDIAVIEAWAYDTGRSSVRIRLLVDRENPLTGERERTCESTFVFVAVDDEGGPIEVPKLEVASERGEELREAGRRAERED